MIRKLAREAVIFMLSSVLLAAVGGFIIGYRETPFAIRVDWARSVPISEPIINTGVDCYTGDGDLVHFQAPPGFIQTQCKPDEIPRPKTAHPVEHLAPDWRRVYNWNNLWNDIGVGLLLGVWGFPAGLGLWGLYRMIHFAIAG